MYLEKIAFWMLGLRLGYKFNDDYHDRCLNVRKAKAYEHV